MALRLTTQNDFTFVEGAYTPTTTPRSVLLGPSATSGMFGAHAVGVDAPFDSPVYVRAYGDPTRVNVPFLTRLQDVAAERFSRVGYVGFVQAALLGTPVPPEVVGGDIARLQPYSAGEDQGHVALAFMGPGDARARLPATEPPFFAYNATLFSSVAQVEDFGRFGQPTGSLWFPQPGSVNPMNGPSMLAQVNVPLVTEAEVAAMVARLTPLVQGTVSAQHAATTPLYQLVVDAVRASTGNRWIRADVEQRLTLADISRIRLAGSYMLLNVANGEHLEPVLCARLTGTNDSSLAQLTVHLLDYDHLRGAEEMATLRLVNDGVRALQNEGRSLQRPTGAPQGRGGGGLLRPSVVLDGGADVLRIRLSGVMFGMGRATRGSLYIRGMVPLSGFEVDLVWRYDAETRILVLDPTPQARAIDGGESAFRVALDAFGDAYGTATPQTSSVDVSAFQLINTGWAAPDPSQPRPARLANWEDAD
jgi:hypothetical protein